ncbi:hypothetical protein RRU01S_04_00810 [Agrobacterium rubi TR3 = NBRC 13261]|uniref:Uncharacterized protein n=1 Tax=Agrobacterium rubi TR3 = NBRC 13261 TaxID=1368415 RepID=A0A081CRG3_9HYPH|nr:hypothetical protein RRU01S_04_00810 [Agrobacterium rubi TR3 = NBRC 13261]
MVTKVFTSPLKTQFFEACMLFSWSLPPIGHAKEDVDAWFKRLTRHFDLDIRDSPPTLAPLNVEFAEN